MVTLDIKYAFTSAPWNQIIKSLEAARYSDYLINMVKHYLNNFTLHCCRCHLHCDVVLMERSCSATYAS